MHKKITDIQNGIWAAYKNFIKTKDTIEYTAQISDVVEKYKDDPLMLQFAENIAISWVPVINAIVGEEA